MCDRDVRMHANKLFEFSDLPAVAASPRFHSLKNFVDRLTDQGIACTTRGTLQSTNLNDPTTWYRHTLHYLRAWEYVRILEVLAIPQHAAVLDVGGAATPFLFYLAEELSCRIVTVDLQQPRRGEVGPALRPYGHLGPTLLPNHLRPVRCSIWTSPPFL